MSEYNIQINKYDALNADYDQLYPATKIENVDGLDTALQNKAPTGYGYGDSISYQFTGDSDGSKFDNAINAFLAEKKSGVFQIKFQSSPFLDTVGCVGTLWTFGDGKYAVLKGVSYFGELVQRTRYDGVWSPWEWLNPPMKLGVEYRTTERYQGKPVYVKAVDCGAMPASTNKSVEHGIENISAIISCTGYFTNGNDPVSLPYARGTVTNVGSIWASKTSIVVWVDNSTYTNCNAYGIIKYTKVTD